MSLDISSRLFAHNGREMRPMVFGEVLFDHFPDRAVLGGAPFNVAWNLKGFGLNPLMLTAIGHDDEGESVRQQMNRWEMDVGGVQVTEDYPTGRVEVTIRDGQPSYEIVRDQAYDFLQTSDLEVSNDEFALLYHGSLAWRSEVTRSTLRTLISTSGIPRFVDVNVRMPHFEIEWLDELVPGATWVKVNDDELAMLAEATVESSEDIAAAVEKLCRRYGRAVYFVTAGSRGAYAIENNRVLFQPAPKPPELRDTVGAGDAFAAMTIEGILRKRDVNLTIKRAVEFAARVCGINGATSDDLSLYRENAQ